MNLISTLFIENYVENYYYVECCFWYQFFGKIPSKTIKHWQFSWTNLRTDVQINDDNWELCLLIVLQIEENYRSVMSITLCFVGYWLKCLKCGSVFWKQTNLTLTNLYHGWYREARITRILDTKTMSFIYHISSVSRSTEIVTFIILQYLRRSPLY